ncbi:MAG TPA: SurA N-terminal domain-containing protein [Gaiellales bacterium]|jgi:foldase protein PrsA|nr:SurA N-terminal domain-containing protein [Gaiellales bacterium]
MSRFRIVLLALLISAVALAAACGGGSGSGSTAASLNSDDVAVVGDIHITRSELDHQIQLQEKSAEVSKQTLPKPGTADFKTQVTDPVLQRLVNEAEIENIAKILGISVSDSEVQKKLQEGIQQQFGSQDKYQAFLKKYGITEQDIIDQAVRPSLLQTKIADKLKSQYKITDAQVKDYYNKNKASFAQPDSRKVHYILAKDKADADAARTFVTKGGSWGEAVKKWSLDYKPGTPPAQLGALTATKGQLETNFENSVFNDLQTGGISIPVAVSKSYEQSNLAGKCKPQCYFLIRADADTVKGSQQSLDQVKAQIMSTLEQSVQAQKVSKRVQELIDQQHKITKYADGYKPTPPPSTSGG